MSGRVNNLNMMNKIQNIKARLHGLTAAIILGLGAGSSIQALDFNEGEHVVFICNALAERMQHHGWLESYIQGTMAEKELVFRNHGFGGDKVNNRPRNNGFPSADAYLEISKADVILALRSTRAFVICRTPPAGGAPWSRGGSSQKAIGRPPSTTSMSSPRNIRMWNFSASRAIPRKRRR